MGDVTLLLRKVADNDRSAIGALFQLLYDDVHRMARARLRDNSPNTLLDTSALAHEAYLRLQAAGRLDLDSRGRFMAYLSQVLRAIIVDFARARNAARRGGDYQHVTMDTNLADGLTTGDEEIERVDEALIELDKTDPRLRQVVEMRYFGGLTEQEVAEALGVSDRTVRRDWERARLLLSAWLRR